MFQSHPKDEMILSVIKYTCEKMRGEGYIQLYSEHSEWIGKYRLRALHKNNTNDTIQAGSILAMYLKPRSEKDTIVSQTIQIIQDYPFWNTTDGVLKFKSPSQQKRIKTCAEQIWHFILSLNETT